ncbi:hypothetical protein ACTXT7_010025 [Hymenolepis weldensis]
MVELMINVDFSDLKTPSHGLLTSAIIFSLTGRLKVIFPYTLIFDPLPPVSSHTGLFCHIMNNNISRRL